jgi:hypothetical protein
MPQERLHPYGEHEVIREVIPGGGMPRQLTLYPNRLSARIVQWLDSKRFIPDTLVMLVDDGKPLEPDFLSHEETFGHPSHQTENRSLTHAS